MARSAVTLLLCGWLLACGSEEEPTARFAIEFASSALRERAALVRAEVREGNCAGVAVFATDIGRGAESRAQPGRLASGIYGLWAAARDDSCNWYAEGCRLFKVPVSRAELVVVLEARAPKRDASCGGLDAGASSGIDPQASGGASGAANDGFDDAAAPNPSDGGIRMDAGASDGGGASGSSSNAGASGGTDGETSSSGADAGASGADAGSSAGSNAGGSSGADGGGSGSSGATNDAGTDAGSGTFDPRAPKCQPPAASVVACYDFDGSLSDATLHRNDAGGTARFEAAVSGQALRVGGNTIRVLDDATLNLSAFTIELWVRIDNLLNLTREQGAPSVFVDKDQQYTVGFLSGGSLFVQLFRAAGDTEITVDDSAIDVGNFRYLAFAYDGNRTSIYLDGTLIASETLGLALFGGNGGSLHIGSGSPSTTSPFDGLIDALRISRVSIPASEICHNAGGRLSAGVCR